MHMDFMLDEETVNPIIKNIWENSIQTSPLSIKKTLDQMLIKSKIKFLTGSYVSEVLIDKEGSFTGITMVNRSGRQIVKGKVLIDATEHASLARQTNIPFSKFKPGKYKFTFR